MPAMSWLRSRAKPDQPGTTLLEDGADLRTVQELLRYKAVATTQIYTKVPDERRHAVINWLHPFRGVA
jgi:integrase/recombinase XerD